MSFLSARFHRLSFEGLVGRIEVALVVVPAEEDAAHHYWASPVDCLRRRNAAETTKAD